MKRVKLTQITDENTALNTTSLSKFKKRVSELSSNIQNVISSGLCGEFNKIEFDSEVEKLSYYVNNMYVMSDEEYEKFEDSLCYELDDYFKTELSK